jgi:hypothetical protein
MNTQPVEKLEARALEQRNQLHRTAMELKSEVEAKIAATREKLNISRNAREHMLGASLVLGLLALLSGYSFAGMFTRD